MNIHPIIKDILSQRGVLTQSGMEELFSWDIQNLPAFSQLLDMEKAVKRILEALDKKQKICIYGDYDVDGTTSCAVFYHFFQLIDYDVTIVQPGRFIEGYGLHVSSVEKAKEDGFDLLITVDCGITNDLACTRAKEIGLDVIITDHHADGAKVQPEAIAIINPNRRECIDLKDNPFRNLAGVGVAFAVCTQLRKALLEHGQHCPSIYSLLQFVSIGTICDCVPLNSLNLKLARHGLKQMIQSEYPGIRAFFKDQTENIQAQERISQDQVGFTIGPMINSKGRLEHPDMALKMLTTNDSALAYHYHFQLQNTNSERKKIQAKVFEQAKIQIQEKWPTSSKLIAYAYDPDWHEGVVGIVASKLVELFKVPAIVLTESQDKKYIKASARTYETINIFETLNGCKELFVKFGGHKAAAGFSIMPENLHILEKKLEDILAKDKISCIDKNTIKFDKEVKFDQVNVSLAQWLEALGPFGSGNPLPIFKLSGITITAFKILKSAHLKWTFGHRDFPLLRHQGITFFYFQDEKRAHPDILMDQQSLKGVDITFTLNINYFKGQRYLQLQVLTIEISK